MNSVKVTLTELELDWLLIVCQQIASSNTEPAEDRVFAIELRDKLLPIYRSTFDKPHVMP